MCTKEFKSNSGELFFISITDNGELITVTDIHKTKLGTIQLEMKEDDFYNNQYYYYITDLSLEKCRKKGIGRASLIFHKKLLGLPLCAASTLNPRKNLDGSHLIGDGVPFIQKMRFEGIVCKHQDESYD